MTEPVTFEVSLPRDLPTPNRTVRMLWPVKARMVKGLRTSVHLQALSARRGLNVAPADGPRRLELVLVRGKGQRMLDGDNAYAALKAAIDGLKDAGWVVDDALNMAHITVTQEKGAEPVLRVTVSGVRVAA